MQSEFFVSKNDRSLGPWSIQEIAQRLASSEIAVTDFIFDDEKQEWVALLDHAPLKAHLQAKKPKAPPPPLKTASETKRVLSTIEPMMIETKVSDEWFVQKGQNRFGPFTYLGVLKGLQDKTIFEFDVVWKSGMDSWTRIAELKEFSSETIKTLRAANQDDEAASIFMKRRYPRLRFDSDVLVHDNQLLWTGRSFEGSVEGSGLVINNAKLVPGQVLLVHFSASESNEGRPQLKAFNSLCEIVSKKFVSDLRDGDAPVQYGVRFVRLDSNMQSAVQNYFHQNHNVT